MITRSGLLASCAASALLVGTAATPVFAQQPVRNWAIDTTANTAANLYIYENMIDAGWGSGYNAPLVAATPVPAVPVKAPPAPPAPVAEPWWFHGFIEFGGRGFINNPQDGGSRWQGGGQSSLAKYYEYSDIRPGPFGDFWFGTGSPNGLYEIDAWGRNVGYDDQRYIADFSKAGEHYLTFGWDQTPHVYSDGATTLYNGVGTNHLTLPPGLSNRMFNDAGCIFNASGPTGCGSPISAANAAKVQSDILTNAQQIGLGIRRDTASVDYRYTPTDAWDVRVNYTNTRRTGTQVDGVVFAASTSGVVAQVPKPVADTTQNYGASAEYAGTSPWSQKYNIKVAYSGSTYTDDSNSYLVDNPFCSSLTTQGDQCARNGAVSSPTALMSLWPSNQANGGTLTLGADLPYTSRYMGTVSYIAMRQNDQFLPFTITSAFANNGGASVPLGWKGIPGIAANSVLALPAQSLNGQINTLLINNVLTTQITPTLKSKLSYRYYDYDNDTPELRFADWVQSDATAASVQSLHAPVTSLSMSYIKQNAGADLNWRPTHEWNLGAGYAFERYDWTRMSVSATNENTARFFADWKPTGWLTARGSISYGLRREDNYDYLSLEGLAQWSPGSASLFSSAERQFFLDNRDRTLGKLYFDIALSPTVTVTPTLSVRNDWYRIDPTRLEGLMGDTSYSAGVELSYAMSPTTTLLLAYMNEHQLQKMNLGTSANPPFTPANLFTTRIDDRVNTVMFGVNHTVIPNKFDIKAMYTLTSATDHQPWNNQTQTAITAANQFPDVKTLWQRFDLMGVYTFDKDWVHSLGWKGTVQAKLRYAWERNSVMNWQNDEMSPYMFSLASTTGYMTWMAYDNPNYNAQMISGSIVVGW